MMDLPRGLPFSREKHLCKAVPSALTWVAEFYFGWKLKVKGAYSAEFVREKVKMLVQIYPKTPVHDDKGG